MAVHYFTLGQNHVHQMAGTTLDKDIVIRIDHEDPRAEMFRRFGDVWAFEYKDIESVKMEYYSRGIYDLNTHKILKVGEEPEEVK